MPDGTRGRIAYIDWLRGFACVVMFQTHCFDSWLRSDARHGRLTRWSQLGGTLPAPLFLFLAGISVALITDKLRQRGTEPRKIARSTIRRGAEILLLALLFRVQEYLLVWFRNPWTDILRVDVLNVIGVSLMAMGLACWIAGVGNGGGADEASVSRMRVKNILVAVVAAGAIVALTPQLWTTWQPHWLVWWLQSYVNGVQMLGTPQPWMFPLFPWAGFAFAGLAVGFLLLTQAARKNEEFVISVVGACGALLILAGAWLDSRPLQVYSVYDFWHTSPNFFLIRCGAVMLVVWGGYLWCRWGPGQEGFSPLIEMGRSSLLIYWVHIELVYGVLSILPKRNVGAVPATIGLVVIFVAMSLLATARNRGMLRFSGVDAFFRRTARGLSSGPNAGD